MDQSFISYVFRPHHIVIAIIALRGIFSGNNTGTSYVLFIGEIMHFIARGVWYFVEQRAWLKRWKQKEHEKNQSAQESDFS